MKKNIIIFISGIIFAAILGLIFTKAPFIKKAKGALKKVKVRIEEQKFNKRKMAKEALVISNFENTKDFQIWQVHNAELNRSDEFQSKDKYSAKINFLSGKVSSGIKIEKYFETNKQISNWLPYSILTFNIFNPQDYKAEVILQIKDKKDKRLKKKIGRASCRERV